MTATLDEFNKVKAQLIKKKFLEDVNLKNWTVHPAPPPNDVIWTDLSK